MSTVASASRRRTGRPISTGRPRRLGAAVLAVGVVVGSLVALTTSTTGARPAAASGPTIVGSGSSYAAVAINQWASQVAALYGDSINYQTTSSVIGLNEFAQQQIDFGASEIGYSTGQANYTPPKNFPYQYLPDIAGAECLMYNLKGSVGEPITDLKLNSAVMLGIFSGTITTWNNPQIEAINPGVPLPSSPIIPVFRTDPSGDNYLFGYYLSTVQPTAWAKYVAAMKFPPGPSAIWPTPQGSSTAGYSFSNFVGQSGSDNASDYVSSSTGTITYVETAYALLHDEPCAYIENASGNWLGPSEYSDAVALLSAQLLPDLEQKLQGVYLSTAKYAYPISAYSYLLTQEGQFNPEKGAVLGRFIRYFACWGQESAGRLGYSPIPTNLVQDDFNGIRRIAGAAPPPATPTAANCPDPYLTDPGSLPGAGGTNTPPPTGGTTGDGTGGGTTSGGGSSTTGTATGSSSTTGAGSVGHGAKGSKSAKGSTSGTSSQPTGVDEAGGTDGVTATTEQPGLALLAASLPLKNQSSPWNSMLSWSLALLALIAVPPTVAVVRRLRREAAAASAGRKT